MSEKLREALDALYVDYHRWSTRPCTTCRNISEATGIAFGCDKMANRQPETALSASPAPARDERELRFLENVLSHLTWDHSEELWAAKTLLECRIETLKCASPASTKETGPRIGLEGIEVGLEESLLMDRQRAIEIARKCAKEKPQSYYSEPFQPHEWVIDAIIQAFEEAAEEASHDQAR